MNLLRLLALLGGIIPGIASAQINPCPLGNAYIPCSTVYGAGAAGLNAFIDTEIFLELRIAFAGVMLFFLVYYAVRLILESGDETTAGEIKQAYGHAVTGAVFVSMAGLIVGGVGNSAAGTLLNSQQGGPLWTIFSTIIIYGKWLMGTLVLIFIVFQGVRLVILHGQDSEVEKQKTRFFHGLIGVAVVLLSSAIVNAVTGSQASILGTEAKGIASFMLEVFGLLVVISFIVSGLFLVLSVDEGLKDRAKKAFYASVIGMVVVFSSYMIVSYVLTV